MTGFISERLIVDFGMGQHSLRYAISAAILFSLVAAFMYWRASGSLIAEMRYAREESARACVVGDMSVRAGRPARRSANRPLKVSLRTEVRHRLK
ncbi:MAG TPA: hypothetical protein VJ673_12295 [Aromatoleum sp.]|uniref:hypothetical protein n=1 Tax=Aromatoleum sp. TaxID=2307007 RepID=UPI002B4840A0|nr:hypothetical protein [Aromatoleum sp.]HJV26459.1 hypothetical protein [Aromatoleum sp.]